MKTKIILLACAMTLSVCAGANAQEPSSNENGTSAVVATVGITDAKVVSQKENTLNIAFDITNRTGAQPGLKYAVTLLKQDGQEMKVFDQQIYDETLSVGADETVHREITYVAPGSLKGKYVPMVEVRNSEGFMFQTASLGEITLQGSAQAVYIAGDSCKLILSSEPEKNHSIEEALDVKEGETLKIRCDVESTFQSQKQMVPEFSVYYRSLFGKRMINEKGAQIEVAPNQKSTIELNVPKAGDPQLYAATIRLLGQTNNETSNAVQLLYNIPGESAAIQNVQLDKDSYRSGETAKVTVFFLGGDGNGGIKGTIDGGELIIDIKDGQGNACAQTSFEKQKTDLKSEYEIAITKTCTDPTVSVSVKGKDGKELAKNVFKVETKNDQQQNLQTTLGKSENTKNAAQILGIILAVICLILIIFILYKKRKSGIRIFIFGIVATGSLVLVGQSRGEAIMGTRYASSQTINAYTMQGYLYATYRGNFNKTTYNEGETITVTSSGTFYLNATDKFTIDVYDRILTSSGSSVYSVTRSGLNGVTVNYPSFNITAPTCSGCGRDYDRRSNFGRSTALSGSLVHIGGHFAGSVMTDIDCSNSGTPRQGECGYLGSISYGNGVSIGFDVPNPIDSKCGDANGKTYQSALPGGRYNNANEWVYLEIIKNGTTFFGGSLCSPTQTDFPSISAVTESSGKINWTCYGQDGGSNATCSATATPAPSCGDGTCNGGETCSTCSNDCGACSVTPTCGDKVCNGTETCTTCPGDCGICTTGFVCTGLVPDNSALVVGDNIGLTVNTARTLVAANTAAKCEYICNPGFTLSGGKCVAACSATPIYTCSYNPPLNEDICKDKNELVSVEATCNCDGCSGVCPAKTTLGDCNSKDVKCSPKVINCANTGNRKLPGGYQEIVP